jgi:hypothetical protein
MTPRERHGRNGELEREHAEAVGPSAPLYLAKQFE